MLLKRWATIFRGLQRYLLPLIAELAVYFALVYGVALVVQASCRPALSAEEPGLHLEGVELTCEIAKNVGGALHLEFAVLFERIKAKLAADENDPALFVLGTEYKALVDFKKSLNSWVSAHCLADV